MIQSYVTDFALAARIDANYALQVEKWEAARRVDERIEKVKEADKRTSEDTKAVLLHRIVAGVSAQELQEIEERVGFHQEAVIEALQENREQLDASDARLEEMLGEAFVLEDGRRVFKTEDGLRVFDEHGKEVEPHDIDAALIEDWRPSAESYLGEARTNFELLEQHRELIEYQSQLDAAQEKIGSGNLSREDYDELNDLLADAPDAVRARLPESDPASLSETIGRTPATASDLDGLAVDGPVLGGVRR